MKNLNLIQNFIKFVSMKAFMYLNFIIGIRERLIFLFLIDKDQNLSTEKFDSLLKFKEQKAVSIPIKESLVKI